MPIHTPGNHGVPASNTSPLDAEVLSRTGKILAILGDDQVTKSLEELGELLGNLQQISKTLRDDFLRGHDQGDYEKIHALCDEKLASAKVSLFEKYSHLKQLYQKLVSEYPHFQCQIDEVFIDDLVYHHAHDLGMSQESFEFPDTFFTQEVLCQVQKESSFYIFSLPSIQIQKYFEVATAMSQARHIFISLNQIHIPAEFSIFFQPMTNLKFLNLGRAHINLRIFHFLQESINFLPKIRVLKMTNFEVVEAGVDLSCLIRSLPCLRSLDLSWSTMSKPSSVDLFQSIPPLHYLSVKGFDFHSFDEKVFEAFLSLLDRVECLDFSTQNLFLIPERLQKELFLKMKHLKSIVLTRGNLQQIPDDMFEVLIENYPDNPLILAKDNTLSETRVKMLQEEALKRGYE